MMFNVPQYIDIEDKIAGPFTAKQLGWLFAGGGALLVLYSLFDTATLAVTGLPVLLLSLALAFYKPNGVPFSKFLVHALLYVFRPKIAVWERPVRQANTLKIFPEQKKEEVKEQKHVTVAEISEIARMIDQK